MLFRTLVFNVVLLCVIDAYFVAVNPVRVKRSNDRSRLQRWCSRQKVFEETECFDEITNYCKRPRRRNYSICRQYGNIKQNEPADSKQPGQIEIEGARPSGQKPGHTLQQPKVRSAVKVRSATTEKAKPDTMKNLKDLSNNFMKGLAEKFIGELKNTLGRSALSDLVSPTRRDKSVTRELTEADVNAEMLDNFWETDIDLTNNQAEFLLDWLKGFAGALTGGGRRKRKVSQGMEFERWTQFPISYQFNANVPQRVRKIIREAIKLWEDNTCIRWQENGANIDRVEFVNGAGCSSFVGRSGGTQEISIYEHGCDRVGIVSHEIGHSLGFFHEQNRPDQKDHVKINYPNIWPNYYNNFLKANIKDVNYYDAPYDYGSVMHYDGWTKGFTIFPTDYAIIAKDPGFQKTMGQRNGPTFVDFKQVNNAYCKHKCRSKPRCEHEGYANPNNCTICRCPSGFGGRLCDQVEPSTAGCGGILEATSVRGRLGGHFSKGDICNWLIKAPKGHKVWMRFKPGFEFACTEPCSYDFVEIKKGRDFQSAGYRFCCNKAPSQTFVSNGNIMVVMVRTLRADPSFTLEYWTDVRGPSGRRTQPPVTVEPVTRPEVVTTPPIPSTFAPVGPCYCNSWTPWTSCDFDCGGCGFQERDRKCRKANECHQKEKKRCNLKACEGVSDGLTFRSGKLQLMYAGCCVGLFNTDGVCTGIADTLEGAVSKIFGVGR